EKKDFLDFPQGAALPLDDCVFRGNDNLPAKDCRQESAPRQRTMPCARIFAFPETFRNNFGYFSTSSVMESATIAKTAQQILHGTGSF
ncbi:MAG: hypothetical protein ACI4QT_09905, partial [Kiritimatiellia bacterium]